MKPRLIVWALLSLSLAGSVWFFHHPPRKAEASEILNPQPGTVTSITAGTGLTGGTITSSGTIALSTPVSVANGGTGAVTLTSGAYLKGAGTSALTTQATPIPIADGGTNASTALSGSSLMVSNGSAVVQGAAGTATTLLHGNATGTPTYSAASLTADISGVLPIANGGTNNSAAYTAGSVLFSNGTSLTQNNANLFWDNTNLRLGIGTTSPGSKLTVQGSNTDAIATANTAGTSRSWYTNVNGWNAVSTNFAVGGNTISFPNDGNLQAGSGQFLSFGPNAGTEAVRITSGGSVGIGTATPQTIVQISSGVPTLTLRNSAGGVDSKNWDWQVVDQNTLQLRIVNDGYTSAVNALTVLRSGMTFSGIGIGTATPNSLLEVNGNLRITRAQGLSDLIVVPQAAGEPVYWFNLGTTNFWGVRSNGVMQLGPGGMTSNGTVLNYSPSGSEAQIRRSAALFIDFGSLVGDSELTLQSNTSNVAGRVGLVLNQNTALASTARVLEVREAGTARVAVAGGGSVGIGTTSPADKLQIDSGHVRLTDDFGYRWDVNTGWYGHTTPSSAVFAQTSAVTRLFIDNGGNVGIGTTSPSRLLHVAGRYQLGGTAIATTDWALTSGWGANATISAVTGTDSRGTVTVTTSALDTPGLNPVVTLTFKDGTWTTTPFCSTSMRSTGTGPLAALAHNPLATTLAVTFIGTPTALSAFTYVMGYQCVG